MSTLALFLVALGAAFAVVLAVRAHSELEETLRELGKINAKLSATEMDLSTLTARMNAVQEDPTMPDHPPSPALLEVSPETRHADPRVYVQRVPDQPHDRVILSNRSPVAAHDLTLELTGHDGETPFLPEFVDQNFPVDILQRGVPYIVLASFRESFLPPLDARLVWRDPDGTRQVREFPLRW